MAVDASCALCGKPPGSARWKEGDSWCHGCQRFICFDCHIKGPGVIPSGPHSLELHKKGAPQREDLHLTKPKPQIINVSEQQELGEPMIVSEGESVERNKPDEDIYDAVCVDEIDLGEEKNFYYDANKKGSKEFVKKVRLIWELDALDPDTKQRFTVAQKYTASLHEKSTLRPLLEKWRGKPFTKDELAGFDLEKVVGVPCRVVIVHSADKKYANVDSVLPGKKKMAASSDFIRTKDRPPKEGAAPTAVADGVDPEMPF